MLAKANAWTERLLFLMRVVATGVCHGLALNRPVLVEALKYTSTGSMAEYGFETSWSAGTDLSMHDVWSQGLCCIQRIRGPQCDDRLSTWVCVSLHFSFVTLVNVQLVREIKQKPDVRQPHFQTFPNISKHNASRKQFLGAATPWFKTKALSGPQTKHNMSPWLAMPRGASCVWTMMSLAGTVGWNASIGFGRRWSNSV